MDGLTMIAVGIAFLPSGVLLIKYTYWKTKKNKSSNIYDFNLYFASGMLVFTGIVLIFEGISHLIRA